MVANAYNPSAYVKVYFETWGSGKFLLGTSVLDGTDPLSPAVGTSSTEISAQVNSIDFHRGMSTDGALRQLDAGTCSISLTTKTFNPWIDNNIRVGMRVWVYGNTSAAIFVGKISSLGMSYDPSGWLNVSLSLVDGIDEFASSRITDYTTVGTYDNARTVLDALMTASGFALTATSSSSGIAKIGTYDLAASGADVQIGDIVNDVQLAELGWFYGAIDDYYQLAFRKRTYNEINPGVGLWYGTSRPGGGAFAKIESFEVDLSTTNIANSYKLTSSWDTGFPEIIYKDQDSIDLYGEVAQDFAPYLYVGLTDGSELTAWAENFPATNLSRRVSSITINAFDETGALRAEAYAEKVGSTANIYIETNGYIISDSYLILSVNHSITPNDWKITYELWKK